MKNPLKFNCIVLMTCMLAALCSCKPEDIAELRHSISLSCGTGGAAAAAVDGTSVDKAVTGTTVTLTATPDSGYVFDKWSDETGGVIFRNTTTPVTTFIMPNTDVKIKAEFRRLENPGQKFAISLINGTGGTAAASIDGQNVAEAEEGAMITLTATPQTGYVFDKWTTPSQKITFTDAGAPSTTFAMPAEDAEIKAEFKPTEPVDKYAIAITCGTGGTAAANVGGTSVTEAESGATVTLIAKPAQGYAFDKWTALSDGVQIKDPTALTTTFTMPAAAVRIGAEFTPVGDDVDVFTKITDPIFKEYCKQFDTDKNGKLSLAEAREVKEIKVSGLGMDPSELIASLAGVEYFINLVDLGCSYNQLTELNLSQNKALTKLDCSKNKLTELNMSDNTALVELWCNNNVIGSLDMTKNPLLRWFECDNNSLASIDVSENAALFNFSCIGNKLTSLDVSKNTALGNLKCTGNLLTGLDLSANKSLKTLFCDENRMSALSITDMGSLSGGVFSLGCGNQTTDGTTALTLSLTLRENQKTYYLQYLKGNPENANVVVAE